jgi:outer membrane cobalamin receptor
MIRTIIIVLLAWTSIAHAEDKDCGWDDSIPCVTIAKGKLGNSNQLGDRITPTSIITKSDMERHNLIDLPSVLNFTQGMDVTQSGPTGQQGTIFLRGTNSNHTLVLLNGIPINDFSTPTGAFDIGPEFMFGVQQVEVYKGTAAAHWGADAIGGAVNLITTVDYDNKISVGGSGDSRTINGNYHTRHNDWDINISAGTHESETQSALAGANEKDGVENKTVGINISRWFDNINFRTNFMTRNTFADIDGHSLAIQDGKWSDNTFYALQTGLDHVTKSGTNSLTLHTHAYDRDYDDAHYESQTYMVRAQHQTDTWGVGFDYKNDESLTGDHDNLGYFFNTSYNIFSLHYRQDREHDSYKVGFLQPLSDSFTIRGNYATGYKNRTTWGAEEFSDTQEISLDYNRFTTTFFQSDVGNLNSNGLELSYGTNAFRVFASHLNSKTNDTVNLRRPEWNLGLMHNLEMDNDWSLTTNYKFKGEHLDVHNSNWNTISMPETHLLDLTLSKNWYGIDLGVTMTNLFDERYESPHGFGQDGRRLQFGFRRSF